MCVTKKRRANMGILSATLPGARLFFHYSDLKSPVNYEVIGRIMTLSL